MAAFITQSYGVSDPSTSYTALVAASGDSLIVPSFPLANPAYLQAMDRIDATKGVFRVRSPKLYDNVKGIHIATAENPTIFSLPRFVSQELYPQDTLIVEDTGSASTFSIVTLGMYFTNLPGVSQRLHAWGEVAPLIQYIYTIEVAVTNSGTANTWTDTALTTTDNLLRANTDHAILGYATDLLCGAVCFKGPDTSSTRVGGPGKVAHEFTDDYFVRVSNETGRPCIPVFNSANAGASFVSTIDITTSSTPNITLIVGMLSANTLS
jgi:hypothetical protein